MRHSVNIFVGNNFNRLSTDLQKYISKYGDNLSPYYTGILWDVCDDGAINIKTVNAVKKTREEILIGNSQDEYNYILTDSESIVIDTQTERLTYYFTQLHSDIITAQRNINDINSDLLINIYITLYDEKCWNDAKRIIDIVKNIEKDFSVDIFGISYDMAKIFMPSDELDYYKIHYLEYKESTKKIIKEIAEYKKSNPTLCHFVLIQDSNSDKRSLNLDFEVFSQIVGEYVLLGIEQYREIFGDSLAIDDSKPITAVGIAIIDFDKYYYVQYLLNKTFIHLLKREGIEQNVVDIQKSSNEQHNRIKKHLKVYSEFYDKEVKPLLIKGETLDDIASHISEKLDKKFEEIESDMKSYVKDCELSLPDKMGILSMLIGEDNEMLGGEAYRDSYDTIDDIAKDPSNFFINENNKLVKKIKDETTGEYTIISGPLDTPIDDNGNVYNPIDELKALKTKIRDTTSDIRKKEELLKSLDACIVSDIEGGKRLTEKGFLYNGTEYKLITGKIEEKPLEKTYVPHSLTKKSVDIRQSFTDVKNQGRQGSCVSFAVTSVYEYILNKEKQLEKDLSEAFLYYNTRDISPDESTEKDEGSSIYYSIKVLEELGICPEELCPYDENVFNLKPSETAYEKAKEQKVAEAQNVELNIDAIKSAVEDGYPVIVSLNLYDSFNPVNGFISRPTDEEIKDGNDENKHGRHAMVICGYSEDERIFIVRNSWGKDFGVNGYCYIPYSYIGDSRLINYACIITKLCNTEIKVVGCSNSSVVHFNQNDSAVQTQIVNNIVNELKFDLNILFERYKDVSGRYFLLMQNLGTISKRKEILSGTMNRLEKEIQEESKIVAELRSSKQEKVEEVRRKKRKPIVICGIVFLCFVLLAILTGKINSLIVDNFPDDENVFQFKIWWMCIPCIISIGGVLFHLMNIRTHVKNIEEDLDDRITKHAMRVKELKDEKEHKAINSLIAGMFIDKFIKLRMSMVSIYNAFTGYLGNLKVWYTEIGDENDFCARRKTPFIPLLSQEILDNCFEQNKEEITRGLHLYEYFDDDKFDFSTKEKVEQAIIDCKFEIRNKIKDWLIKSVFDFSMIKYWLGKQNYCLVKLSDNQIRELCHRIENESKVFLHYSNTDSNIINKLFVNICDNDCENKWNQCYKNNFDSTMTPTTATTSSNDKIIMTQTVNIGVDDIAFMK